MATPKPLINNSSSETFRDEERQTVASADTSSSERSGAYAPIAALALLAGLAANGCVEGRGTNPTLPVSAPAPVSDKRMPAAADVLESIQKRNPEADCTLTRDDWNYKDGKEGPKAFNTLLVHCEKKNAGTTLIDPAPGEKLPTKYVEPTATSFHVSLHCKAPVLTIGDDGFPRATQCQQVKGFVDTYEEPSGMMTALRPLPAELLDLSSSNNGNKQKPQGATHLSFGYAEELKQTAAQQLQSSTDGLEQSMVWSIPVGSDKTRPPLWINFGVGSGLQQSRSFLCDDPQFQQNNDKTMVVNTKPCTEM